MNKWKRVSRKRPCPICSKPDWCVVSSDGGACICMRQPSANQLPSGGYYHKLADVPRDFASQPQKRPLERIQASDFNDYATKAQKALTPEKAAALANNLHLPLSAVLRLCPGWSDFDNAATFPMRLPDANVCGIRLRNSLGEKWAATGSNHGLFFDPTMSNVHELVTVEGPTDTAALISIGLHAVGRPSCLGCEAEIAQLARRFRCRKITIFADNDATKGHNAGLRGAIKLAAFLRARNLIVRTIFPPHPHKDARQWIVSGATIANWHDLTKGIKFV